MNALSRITRRADRWAGRVGVESIIGLTGFAWMTYRAVGAFVVAVSL